MIPPIKHLPSRIPPKLDSSSHYSKNPDGLQSRDLEFITYDSLHKTPSILDSFQTGSINHYDSSRRLTPIQDSSQTGFMIPFFSNNSDGLQSRDLEFIPYYSSLEHLPSGIPPKQAPAPILNIFQKSLHSKKRYLLLSNGFWLDFSQV